MEPLPVGTSFEFPRRELKGHSSPVVAVQYSIHGKFAITADEEGKVICWDPATGESVHQASVESASPISSVDIHTSGKLAIVVHQDHSFQLLDFDTGKPRTVPEVDDHQVWAARFLSDPTMMLLRAFREASGESHSLPRNSILAIDLESGDVVASTYDTGKLSHVPTDDNRWQIVPSPASSKFVELIGSRNSCQHLVQRTGSKTRGLKVRSWSGTKIWPGGKDIRVLDVAFPLDDQQLCLAASDTGDIRLFRENNSEPDFDLQVALTGGHRRIRWLPGSQFIAIYDGDTAFQHWDAGQGRPAASHQAERSDIACIALAPSCHQGITAYENGEVHFIELPPPIVSGSMMAGAITNEVQEAWQQADFERLDKLAQVCRESNESTESGFPMVRLFYDLLTNPADPTPQQWKAHLDQKRDWIAQRPESATAHISLAESLIAYGWEARGAGTIDTVTQDGYTLFKERVTEAGELLEEAATLDNKHAELYEVQLRAARGIGMPKDVMYLSFRAGQSIDSGYLPLYSSMAISLLPRWYGEFGELSEFLESQREVLDEEQYLRMYAWTFGQIKCFLAEQHLAAFDFDFEAVARGAKLLHAEHPSHLWFANLEAWALTRLGDRQAARKALSQIAGDLNEHFFYSELMFKRVQSWADPRNDSPEQQWVRLADTHAVYCVAYSPDGTIIATGGFDPLRQIKLWDAKTGEAIGSLPAPDTVHALAFHPSQAKLVVAGGSNGSGFINVWNLDEPQAEPTDLVPPRGVPTSAVFSPEGSHLAVGGEGGRVWIWQAKSANAEVVKVPVYQEVRALEFSPDNRRLMVATQARVVFIDIESTKLVDRKELPRKSENQAAIVVDDSLFVSGRTNSIMVFGIGDENAVRAIQIPHGDLSAAHRRFGACVMSLAASPHGNRLVAAHSSLAGNFPDTKLHRLLVFDRESGELTATFTGHSLIIDEVAISPDGTQLASVSRDATLRVWTLAEPKESEASEAAE